MGQEVTDDGPSAIVWVMAYLLKCHAIHHGNAFMAAKKIPATDYGNVSVGLPGQISLRHIGPSV